MRERSMKLSEEHYRKLLYLRNRGTVTTIRLPLCEILELAVDMLFREFQTEKDAVDVETYVCDDAPESRKGLRVSDETRRKLSKAGKEHWLSLSDEEKRCRSEARKGWYQTEEAKRRMSESHKGFRHTNETKQKISDAHMGHDVSEEAKRRMSEAHKGVGLGRGKNQIKVLRALARSQAKGDVEWKPLLRRLSIKFGHSALSVSMVKSGMITHRVVVSKKKGLERRRGFAKITAKGRTAIKKA